MKNQKLPLVSVCWLLTSKCNYNCSFCFKVPNSIDLSRQKALNILNKLINFGVKKISFSGGEPLLFPYLEELIKKAHQMGVVTMIITNGSLLTHNKLDDFHGKLDWITLPLDGSSEKMQITAGRPAGHFIKVINHLESLKNSKYNIKINTVLSKKNLGDLKKIALIIKKYPIKRWKIFQFYPIRHTSIKNKNEFSITDREFQTVKNGIYQIMKDSKCLVYFGSNKQVETSYFTIAPNGTVYISHQGKDIILGDLKTQELSKIWENANFIDKKKYYKRASWILE